jgi:hypothetical protein
MDIQTFIMDAIQYSILYFLGLFTGVYFTVKSLTK